MALNRIGANLNQTITIYPSGVQDKFGKVTYGTGVDYACRFQKVTKNIVTAQNELTPVTGMVFLSADATVAIGSKATFGDVDYKILSVEPLIDGRGRTRHYEAYLTDWNL